VIRSEKLECLILGHGLEFPYLGEEGRTTNVGQLCVVATEKCGDCSMDEVADALYSIEPDHAELKRYDYSGPENQVFQFDRHDPKWREFFNGYFNIRVLPAGRRRFEMLSEQLVEIDDRKFARMAIDEARKSVSESDGRPHPLVGAVVVKNGQVLSVAHRGEASGNHAEYIALEKKLSEEAVAGATVYTTLEPCTTRNHPKIPCAARLIERKVTRVVIGMHDPDERITGRGWLKLRKAGIVVESFPPELVPEVEELNREFTRHCEQEASPEFGVAALQKRLDLVHVSARIEQGTADFILMLTNESDERVEVREVNLLSERGVRLTEPHLLKERNTIEPRKWLTVDWRTQTNPADKLVSLQPAKEERPRRLPNEFETELDVRVTCEALGRVQPYTTRLHVKVDIWNHRIEQIAG
jgi:pyrimidine deaminase RibD-like protein